MFLHTEILSRLFGRVNWVRSSLDLIDLYSYRIEYKKDLTLLRQLAGVARG